MKDINKHLEIIMEYEQILLDALNEIGNFTTVGEEFNDDQLEAIYLAMNVIKDKKDSPLDEVFDSMFNIFKPNNQK